MARGPSLEVWKRYSECFSGSEVAKSAAADAMTINVRAARRALPDARTGVLSSLSVGSNRFRVQASSPRGIRDDCTASPLQALERDAIASLERNDGPGCHRGVSYGARAIATMIVETRCVAGQ